MSIKSLKERTKQLKTDTYTLFLAYKDPRVPWHAKAFTGLIIAYVLSPIDIIPDFIPVLGYLDELIIVPAGIALSLKMIPKEVLKELKEKATAEPVDTKMKWFIAFFVILIWVSVAVIILKFILRIIY